MTTPSEVEETVDLNNLNPGSVIDVETKSRHYHIECLGGNAIRISGHPEYCPDPVQARLQGSIDREGELELGQIGPGMRMMFFVDGQRPVTTSRVVRLHVDQPGAAQPKPSSLVH